MTAQSDRQQNGGSWAKEKMEGDLNESGKSLASNENIRVTIGES